MAAASASMAPRLAATSSAIFMNLSTAALDTESRDLSAHKMTSHGYDKETTMFNHPQSKQQAVQKTASSPQMLPANGNTTAPTGLIC